MRLVLLVWLLAWPAIAAHAAIVQNPNFRTVVSASGQFVVQGPPPPPGRLQPASTASNIVLRLNADQLAITCERVKAVFLRELNFADLAWLSRIQVNILPYAQPDQTINIASVRHTDGWLYQVDVPEQIAAERLVRGLVHVLFLEIANRTSSARSAEIPTWLVEGTARHLLLAYRAELVLEPFSALNALVRYDPITPTRLLLQKEKALTFEQLGRPDASMLTPPRLAVFQASAQLLVVELRRLPAGNYSIATFLANLNRMLNWEVAFLNAFSKQFGSLLDIEKWWALTLVGFTGRDPSQIWPAALAPSKIEQLLQVSVRAAPTTNALPRQTRYTLQELIRTLDYAQHRNLVLGKINQLVAARVNVIGGNLALVQSYQKTLEDYIYKRDRVGFAPPRRGQIQGNPKSIADETVRKLDDLDAKRKSAQPAASLLQPAATARSKPLLMAAS